MSSDDVHGPQGAYPETWDPSGRGRLVAGDDGDLDGGEEIGADQDGGDDLPELELDDDPADARTYQCAGCGATVEFLGDCDDCGEELVWGAV
jgi:hypothetical protein